MTKFWPSRKEALLDNAELLLDSGINITVERNLDILAGESFEITIMRYIITSSCSSRRISRKWNIGSLNRV